MDISNRAALRGLLIAAVLIGTAALAPARAADLADVVQRGREALLAHQRGREAAPVVGADGAARPSERRETSAGAMNIGFVLTGAERPAAAAPVVLGGNGFIAKACVTYYLGGFQITGLLTHTNVMVLTADSYFTTLLIAACTNRMAIAINVTSVSGSSFSYDSVAF